ncbi:MAG TPA: hypothetical protein VNJ01_08795 [Bacteriovoracaceae bacterium]|nr:hypothetical protein [Bacteriovoracaceae bacterium]
MKKSIASIALLVSSMSVHALMVPEDMSRPTPKPKTMCLDTFEARDGSSFLGGCDLSAMNKRAGIPTLQNGCPRDQIAFVSVEVKFKACLPYAQL